MKILSMLGSGYFLKIAKLIPCRKNQSVLKSQRLLPAKQKKLPICKNKLPQKFCATWYDLPYTGWMLLITIELFKDSWTARPYTRFKYSETFIKRTPLGPSQVSA